MTNLFNAGNTFGEFWLKTNKQGNVGDWAAVNYMSKKKDITSQVVWFSY